MTPSCLLGSNLLVAGMYVRSSLGPGQVEQLEKFHCSVRKIPPPLHCKPTSFP